MKPKNAGTLLFTMILLSICFMFFVIYHIIEDNKTRTSSIGCEYVGSLKDLPQIKFFDCKGEIKLFKNINRVNNK